MKVIWNYTTAPGLQRRFEALAEQGLQVNACPEDDDDTLFELLEDADVLWHCLRPVDARVLQAAPRLKLVQKIGVGVNTIDLAMAGERGVAVCNMPGSNSQAVAEQTLALMLAVLRRVPDFDRDVRDGRGWSWPGERLDGLGELGGRTVGLVGYGGVPARLAPVLAALNARVLYTARSDKHSPLAEYRSLDQLVQEADIVSLHVPLTDETERLLDRPRFAAMKPGAVLINTARGGLVDEDALLEALESGRLSGAGLDVFATEPLPPDHPLLQRRDVVLSPHVAWLTGETLARSLAVAVENCRRLAAAQPLLHRVA
ncbi:MAG: 2-hydroxyacid dehydrogenase [Gammaproteobacteria bacterium]|nr:2-hydroxyacid dehydrogenase [Gammaproteobacteria bacterium]